VTLVLGTYTSVQLTTFFPVTQAALAYGLFVSPNVRREDKEKQILVFDMGGGTTDVTVAIMTAETSGDNVTGDEVRFKVVATAGDRCLGGDNVDELLARHLWKKIESSSSEEETTLEWEASQHQELMRKCRLAKEQLCGNEKEDEVGLSKTHFTINGSRVDITRQEFDMAIQPLIDRAENVVDDALKQLHSSDVTAPIHEVVLVGGSSHIPTVRDMLRRKFPPPIPPDLCTSISAETAVAQGLAIQSALVSGDVPLWELRNAMMLDALPHSIGVWVDPRPPIDGSGARYDKGDVLHLRDKSDCYYVEILQKDDPLPARGSATFTLADISQFGVTVVAVERIGANTFQCMGVFSFLLHKLDLQQFSSECTRQVDVGMVLESNGRFVVSVFDNNDPEHRKRKRQFLRQRGIEDDDEEYINEVRYSGTESSLLILCAIVFGIYVATRVAFSELDLQHDDEL
jgi:molecular chaperone DnaK (HSP70)